MGKERFVDEKTLIQHLPIFLCGMKDRSDAKLEKMIDMIEEEVILERATEIKISKMKEDAESFTVLQNMREIRIKRNMGLITNDEYTNLKNKIQKKK